MSFVQCYFAYLRFLCYIFKCCLKVMETKSTSTVMKRKIISSSKLKPIKLNESQATDKPFSSHHNHALMKSDIASVSLSHQSSKSFASIKKSDSFLRSGLFIEDTGIGVGPERVNPFNKTEDSDNESFSSESKLSSGSIDTGLAELGLTEDHFSYREGHLGLSSIEELETAIYSCKGMILKLPEGSKKRRKLVENLVELRIQLQDIKDKPRLSNSNLKLVLGHLLKKNHKTSLKAVCDCCRSSIWGVLQVWYECKECHYICHEKCISSIRRTCVAQLAKMVIYDLSICPEVGLSKQIYCCRECKNGIAIGGGADVALLCDYTGYYYCTNCHWNDALVIPARVLHNWDHTPRKVCRHSYQLLMKMYQRPVLDVEKINPKLFNFVEELAEIRRMRNDIMKMKQYFLTCSVALESKLFWKLSEWQHFVDNFNMYSMKDLVDTNSGYLTEELAKIHILYGKHIKLDCLICQAKGFICEICNSGEALFPFDLRVSICSMCSAVYHDDCFSFLDKMCPRCKRKREKRNRSTSNLSDSDDNSVPPFDSVMTSPPTKERKHVTSHDFARLRQSGDLAATFRHDFSPSQGDARKPQVEDGKADVAFRDMERNAVTNWHATLYKNGHENNTQLSSEEHDVDITNPFLIDDSNPFAVDLAEQRNFPVGSNVLEDMAETPLPADPNNPFSC